MRRVSMNLVVTVLATALIAVIGCRKSVEGETKKFEKRVLEAEKVIALYPSFQPTLAAELKAATTDTKTIAPVKAAAKVKCKYCGKSNVASAIKCASCG
jgi:hypothetical protein